MANPQYVRAFAPATVTNVSCGFDILGFALEAPGDEVILRPNSDGTIRITRILPDSLDIPLEAERNTAGRALLAMQKALNLTVGVDVEIHKQFGMGSGLGSSAASAAAAVWAYNRFLDTPLRREELLPFAIAGERAATGENVHIDNVSASLLGGFIVVRSMNPPDVLPLPYPPELHCAVVHPHLELKTAAMREMLHTHIPLHQAVEQWGNIAGLILGFMQEDYDLIRRSLKDVIVEPIRGQVIPGFQEAQKAALEAGALGSGISGSGPALFALASSHEIAEQCGNAMLAIYRKMGLEADVYVSSINPDGAIILEER